MNPRFYPLSVVALGGLLCVFFAHTTTQAAPPEMIRTRPMVPVHAMHLDPIHIVDARRDPFISPVNDEGRPIIGSTEPGPDDTPPSGADIAPNGSSTPLAPALNNLRITAIVVGARNYALVQDGTTQRMVTLGDKLADSTVKAISLQSVDLVNGLHLSPTGDTH